MPRAAAVDDDQVEHLVPRVQLDVLRADLAHERAVSAKQELLTGLAARVEVRGHLRAAEGTVVEQCRHTRGRRARLGATH
jgi:hypothetical protein